MSKSKPNIEIYQTSESKRWCVKKENMERPSYSFDTRAEAESKGRELAKNFNSKLILMDSDDSVLKKVDFNNRPGMRSYHVERSGKHWVVRSDDRTYAKHRFTKKSEAIKRAQQEAAAHSSVMVVHTNSGSIQRVQDLRGIPSPNL